MLSNLTAIVLIMCALTGALVGGNIGIVLALIAFIGVLIYLMFFDAPNGYEPFGPLW